MKIMYLCGPVSNGGTLGSEAELRNRTQFEIAKRRLDSSVKVLDPTQLPQQASWEDYMRLTIPMLCEADIVVLLNGWEHSRGAVLEVYLANTMNIPIVFLDHLT